MQAPFLDRRNGSIKGPRVPLSAWSSMQDEGITTLYQLRGVAERLIGIGPQGPDQGGRDQLDPAAEERHQRSHSRGANHWALANLQGSCQHFVAICPHRLGDPV